MHFGQPILSALFGGFDDDGLPFGLFLRGLVVNASFLRMSHALVDEKSLAFDALAAQKLARDPKLLDAAMANVERWLVSCSEAARPALLEWQALLAPGGRNLSEVKRLLAGTDERAQRLRQSSPFCGPEFISPTERAAIIAQHKA